VSQIDLQHRKVVRTYRTGLQPTSLLAHGTDLLVTNSNDDSVSVIDTAAHRMGQTINVNPAPGRPYGASPNAMAFLDPTHLAVSLGRDNAIAVYGYRGAYQPASFQGLIPTAWYPGTLQFDTRLGRLVVTGVDDRRGLPDQAGHGPQYLRRDRGNQPGQYSGPGADGEAHRTGLRQQPVGRIGRPQSAGGRPYRARGDTGPAG